jgi:Ca-activated chloride channel family protein
MTFSSPTFLILLVPIFLLLLIEIFYYQSIDIFPKAKLDIKKQSYKNINYRNFKIVRYSFFLGLICMTLSVSGPQFGIKLKKIDRQGVDLVIAFDTSISMDANDVKPSRIEKAKYEIGKLIESLKGDRVSLIVFAGTSHLYLPLTTDYEAAKLFLSSIDTQMIPNQGTSISSALEKAVELVKKDQDKYKVVILISDGEDHEGDAVKIAKQARELGIEIHTVGIGSNLGGLIPIKSERQNTQDYKRDKNGKLITSILNKKMLQNLASTGNGQFFHFSNNGQSHLDLNNAIDNMEKRKINSHEYSDYEERFQPLAFFSFLFLMLSFLFPTRMKNNQ